MSTCSDHSDSFQEDDSKTDQFQISFLFNEFVEKCKMKSVQIQTEGIQGISNLLASQQIDKIDIVEADITCTLLNILNDDRVNDINMKLDITYIFCELLDPEEIPKHAINDITNEGVMHSSSI